MYGDVNPIEFRTSEIEKTIEYGIERGRPSQRETIEYGFLKEEKGVS